MADEVVMGLWGSRDIRVVASVATQVAQTAREKHQAKEPAAHLLGQGLVSASLLSALQLQKSTARINLQLECDGAIRGIFVECDAQGALRGYAKNPLVEFQGEPGAYEWRPVLGNSGYLSVLRDQGEGEFFRSSVSLESFDLQRDMERYFEASEQVATTLALHVHPRETEPLGVVCGVLLQTLPGGDVDALDRMRQRLVAGALEDVVRDLGDEVSAGALLSRLLEAEDFEVTSRYPLQWRCTCSKERVTRALRVLGRDELLDMLARDGKAEAACQFCSTNYLVTDRELAALIDEFPVADP